MSTDSFSAQLSRMFERGARAQGAAPFEEPDEDRLDAESVVVQALEGQKRMGYPDSPAFDDFARRFAFRSYAVRGDGSPRVLVLRGDAVEAEGGHLVQCLQQPGARSAICLHTSGAIHDGGARLVAGRATTPLASKLDRFLEYEAALDALADEAKRWFRLSLRAPDGTTRTLAERLSLSPLEAVNDIGLGAWHRPGFLLRARRQPGSDPIWLLDACASEATSADDFSAICMELLDKSPSRQLWNPA